MHRSSCLSVAAVVAFIPALIGQEGVPIFSSFPVQARTIAKPAQPVLKTKYQRTFRTRIREAAAERPNFSGHYKIAEWGCGAGCVSMAIIDEVSGAVYDPPFPGLTIGAVGDRYEGGDAGLEYKPDSRLLIARGCPNEKDCGTYYYEWSAPNLKLLRKNLLQHQ